MSLISSASATFSFVVDAANTRALEALAFLNIEDETTSSNLLALLSSWVLFKSTLAVSDVILWLSKVFSIVAVFLLFFSTLIVSFCSSEFFVFSTVFSLLESPVTLFSSLVFNLSTNVEFFSSTADLFLSLPVLNSLFSVADAEVFTFSSLFSDDAFCVALTIPTSSFLCVDVASLVVSFTSLEVE